MVDIRNQRIFASYLKRGKLFALQEEDDESRCHEAITKFLFMNMFDEHQKVLASNDDIVLTTNTIPWLNPYEELTEPSENLALLNVAWSKVKSFENRSSETSGIQLLAQHAKTFVLKQDDVRGIKRRWEYANENSLSLVKESQSQESSQSVVMVTELSSLDMDLFLKLYTKKQRTSSNHDVVCSLSTSNNEDENDIRPSQNSNYTVSMETFTKCLLHPDVINVLSSVLDKHLNYQIK
ncbi:hypothetical protein FSP39_023809 [Pinctada imbricata]|uniref:Uncharacterized protein n=1 Tax=Pinctada imbricata TaxID=66713 RepID=A0AA88Y1Z5_PINIB|nr:hypothetical protein FSP39_023809 [Pinctada imbricata]